MLLSHLCVMACIHYVVVVDERGKLEFDQGGLVTCPRSEKGGFGVRAGWTCFLSEPIDDDMVPHAYEFGWSCEYHCII